MHAGHAHPYERQAATESSGAAPARVSGNGAVHGNKKSKIYHLSNCPGYTGMNPASLVLFASGGGAGRTREQEAKPPPRESAWPLGPLMPPHVLGWGGETLSLPSRLFCDMLRFLSYASIRLFLCLRGALSPFLLHHALAFVASAYCSDDLAIFSMLSHKRTLA